MLHMIYMSFPNYIRTLLFFNDGWMEVAGWDIKRQETRAMSTLSALWELTILPAFLAVLT